MKKKFFSLTMLLLCGSSIGFAQLIDVASTQKVALPEGTAADMVTISPKGDYLLMSDLRKTGLQKFDLATSGMQTVTTAVGSEYDAKITDDGNTIVFRQNETGKDLLKKTSLHAIDLTTGQTRTLVKPTRSLQGVQVTEAAVYTVSDRKMKAQSLTSAKADKSLPVAFIEYGQLMIAKDGKVETLSPNGQEGQSYLWPSVSPDGTKVVYYLATQGAYTCNIDGTGVTYLGTLRAPKWYSDGIVVGMHDLDNGEFVTSSEIVACAADGSAKQTLTDAAVIAMYPSVSANGEKIAFSTPAGEAYIININVAK